MSTELDRSIELSGLKLTSPVINGAGPVKLLEHVKDIARSKAGAIVLGSITVEPREGNMGVTYFTHPQSLYSINSKGMPNGGLPFYRLHLPEMVQVAHYYGKPLIVSVAGFSIEEYVRLCEEVFEGGADGVEPNFGCPNVWGSDGKQKRLFSLDPNLTGEALFRIEQAVGPEAWVSPKLSPTDPFTLEAVASVINHFKVVKAVTAINTFPNVTSFNENGEPVTDPGRGFGGLGGSFLKPVGLGHVRQLRGTLLECIAIIGVGGVINSQDLRDYQLAGASATQITTGYINHGSNIFREVLA